MAKKGSSSKRWLQEHKTDEFVQKAAKEGYRGRAAYKLLEVIQKDNIIKPNDIVLDLGAAPGAWCQVAKKYTKNQIIASDILAIEPIENVEFLQGDFTLDETYNTLLTMIDSQKINVVLSDMAPNMSGNLSVDIPKSMYLCELALDMATKVLVHNGVFFIKVFQGAGFEDFLASCRGYFKNVSIKKPKASRPRSKEVYILAKNLK
jgi:23S rRNA (uridine2552-2'-O)-methyltransferase